MTILAWASVPAFGQDATWYGPTDDVYASPPNAATEAEPTDKALGGAKWTNVTYFLDQTRLYGALLSGTTATGTFANCGNYTVPPYTITIKRDGILFWSYSSNVWNNVERNSYRCGLIFDVSKGSQYEVLTPGTYEFRMSQPYFGTDIVKSTIVPPCAAPVPMYSAYHSGYTDNFYTTSYSDLNAAIGLGYNNTGIPFKVSRTNEKTALWKRFFKGSPQVEHFYSHLDYEEQSVYSYGYVYENVEGNVFPNPVTGALPLYRLAQFNGYTGDLQHVYTTNASEVSYYQGQGWSSDGVKGYVCAP